MHGGDSSERSKSEHTSLEDSTISKNAKFLIAICVQSKLPRGGGQGGGRETEATNRQEATDRVGSEFFGL